jgi:hypothetical protein
MGLYTWDVLGRERDLFKGPYRVDVSEPLT